MWLLVFLPQSLQRHTEQVSSRLPLYTLKFADRFSCFFWDCESNPHNSQPPIRFHFSIHDCCFSARPGTFVKRSDIGCSYLKSASV